MPGVELLAHVAEASESDGRGVKREVEELGGPDHGPQVTGWRLDKCRPGCLRHSEPQCDVTGSDHHVPGKESCGRKGDQRQEGG